MLSRREAQAIKGIAILLMFVHHLFGLPALIVPPNGYVGLLPDVPLEYWLGRYGKVCVAVFLFLSGYGLAIKEAMDPAYYMMRILRFLGVYWVYFAVFVTIGAVYFQHVLLPDGTQRYAITPYRLVTNLLTVRTEYNFEWWYAETYLLLMALALPLLTAARAPLALLAASVVAFGLGAVLDVVRIDTPLISVSNLLIWQWPFVAGLLVAQHQATVQAWLPQRAPARIAALVLLVGFILVEALQPVAMTPYLLLTSPLSVLMLRGLVRHVGPLRGPLVGLGDISLQLWLVHTFFCYYFFQDFIYLPGLSVLVLGNLLLCSLISVAVIETLRRTMLDWARRRNRLVR